ncbi:EamA family transporter RarD [Paraneptunicella aestuarii]|uniref:EamA family transporter RarD n=1 Tax=Paraneptunicella aestuarii TaxID=2831148 RepID=UPI001E3CA7A9|nr:EamA family transporter RarD [Paraneptunicella aestuarii]UAA39019.1 EamA family transporter RarD [Paraneptunicella aestuarii]
MQANQTKQGVLLALAAYGSWGVAPMYFKLLAAFPSMDILMHRIVWSVLTLLIIILASRHWSRVRAAIANKRVLATLFFCGFLLAGNWLLFIWAVNHDHLLDASLGYYINPLLNVFLGYMFLGERLRPMQLLAVGSAALGVAILILSYGKFPWIALVLAFSFGIYGLLRKKIPVESAPGLLIESSMLLPIALGYWAFFASANSNMLNNDLAINLILLSAGLVTTIPLICFNAAAKRIQYSTLGFFQYLAPSMMFALAVILYGEPLDQARLVTFAFVWLGLAIYTWDSLKHYRRNRKAKKQSQE